MATSNRTVSVVIPTYNRCDRLRVALDAVCSQNVDDLEVIVVDNNSRDNTASLVKAYPDPRVTYTVCTEQGVYPALNHGFARAKGAYLTWTSDDNWFHEGALQDMLTVIKSKPADFVYSDFLRFFEKTGEIRIAQVREPCHLDEYCCIGPCFLYRREVYERLGAHDVRYRLASDYDFWLRIRRAGFRMMPLRTPRYTFTYHETSVSTSQADPLYAESCRIRLAHGCYRRYWDRVGEAFQPWLGLTQAEVLLRHGYLSEAVLLTGKVLCQQPWSWACWRGCAGRIVRAALCLANRKS